MDQVSDSDAENSLSPLTASAVDLTLLRDVYSLFLPSTRSQIRAEAKRSPFALVYREFDSCLAEDAAPSSDVSGPLLPALYPTAIPSTLTPLVTPRSHSTSLGSPLDTLFHGNSQAPSSPLGLASNSGTRKDVSNSIYPDVPDPIYNDVNADNAADVAADNAPDADTPVHAPAGTPNGILNTGTLIDGLNTATAPPSSRRSLRKRTFSSRHPYIADQADWLGICTVDSINEMFSENDNINHVCKALNKLYLQKRKRYPDEDRYRSKNFYAHLGYSKMLAPQADVDEDQDHDLAEKLSRDGPLDPEPEDENGPDFEAGVLPYDFEIPSSPNPRSRHSYNDENDILRIIDEGIDYDGSYEPQNAKTHYTSESESETSQNSDSEDSEDPEAEELLIRIGGRYRKLSTILRGVLPESTKRLGNFQTSAPRKKQKLARVLPPRKGLAIRKIGKTMPRSSDLEKELNLLAEKDEEPIRTPPLEQAILEFPTSVSGDPGTPPPEVSLPEYAPMFEYILDASEVSCMSIKSDSESDPDVEIVVPDKLLAITPGSRRDLVPDAKSLEYYAIDDDEVQEVDTIDRLLNSTRQHSQKKRLSVRNAKSDVQASRTMKLLGQDESRSFRQDGQKHVAKNRLAKPQRRLGTGRTVFGGLSSGRPRGSPNIRLKMIRPQILKFKTRFEKRPRSQTVLPFKQHDHIPPRQPEAKKRAHEEFAMQSRSNLFRRSPMIATSAFEVEEPDITHQKSRNLIVGANPHLFVPSRESLVSNHSLSSLIGTADIIKASAIEGGQMFFQHTHSVSFSFLGTYFEFSRINAQNSDRNLVRFFALCRRSLATDLLADQLARGNLQEALKHVMQWLLINKERPSEQTWKQLSMTMEHFSKLQTKEVRRSQSIFHSQLLYIFWIFIKLDVTMERVSNMHKASNLEAKLSNDLDKYVSDFWITIFQTHSGLEFAKQSENKEHVLPVYLVQAMYENRDQLWWSPITEALDIVLGIEGLDFRPLNILVALASMVKGEEHSWAPVLAALGHFKQQTKSGGLHYLMDVCTLLMRRLSWPLEERVILQLYAQFAARKFANFADEAVVPLSLGTIRSRLDIPERSVFERFMGLTYEYLSEVGSMKEAKKLISKLLATSQYHYSKGKKSQIMFVNRINLIILFSQISDVDLANQYLNLVEQVKDSHDVFVYERLLDALQVLCDVSKRKGRPIPVRAFRLLFDIFNGAVSLPGLHELYKRFLSYIGFVFQGVDSRNECGVLELLEILGELDMSNILDSFKLDLLGIAFLSAQELSVAPSESLTPKQRSGLTKFNDTLLKFTNAQMSRLPIAPVQADEFLEEAIEFSLEIWIITSKLLGIAHWNIMMLQKFLYVGNPILRSRFIMFFCVEYLNHCAEKHSALLEIDKILLLGMLLPQISKYALDLYVRLNRNHGSIFCLKSMHDINSVFALQTYRVPIICRIVYNIGTQGVLLPNDKDAVVLGLVKRLHEEYSQRSHDAPYFELAKRIMEQVAKYARLSVNDSDEFWELSAKMGLPNKWMHDNWRTSDDTHRVYLLNRQFVCALAGADDAYMKAIDPWIDVQNCHVLYALIQVYCSALSTSDRYWAHVDLLLAAFLGKLQRFDIGIRERAFTEFLLSLVELAEFSRRRTSQYLSHELRALHTCASIFSQSRLLYDGYKDKAEVDGLIMRFVTAYHARPPGNFKVTVSFTDITMDKILQYRTAYRPKPLREPDDVDGAVQETDAIVGQLANPNGGSRGEMPDFLFHF